MYLYKGDCIVSGGYDGTIKLWSIKRRKLMRTFETYNSSVFSTYKCFFAYISKDKNIKILKFKD